MLGYYGDPARAGSMWRMAPGSVPAAWQRINTQSLRRLSAVEPDEMLAPLPTLVRARGNAAMRFA